VSALVAILTLVLLAGVIVAVSAPLRRARRPEQRVSDERALETARNAKYREIRDAELDYRTGKLSREDYEALSRTLRTEAIEILDRLAALEESPGRAERDAQDG
jgi:type II secretory pathway component PulM